MIACLLSAGSSFAAGAAEGDEAGQALEKYRVQYGKCIEAKTAGVVASYGDMQLARVDCGLAADEAAKRDLYVSFRQLERWFDANAEARAELLRGQRAWIEYRDAHCSLKERLVGQQLVQLFCNLELDARRAAELRELVP